MNLTRRQFLKALAASAIAASIPVSVLSKPRQPYVKVGEIVSYIGHCPNPRAFIGANIVHSIGKWNGTGYPVELNMGSYTIQTRPFNVWKPRIETGFFDFDLVNFNRELPPKFWHNHSTEEYPNVHTYVRTKRFGETVNQAIEHLNFATIKPRRA